MEPEILEKRSGRRRVSTVPEAGDRPCGPNQAGGAEAEDGGDGGGSGVAGEPGGALMSKTRPASTVLPYQFVPVRPGPREDDVDVESFRLARPDRLGHHRFVAGAWWAGLREPGRALAGGGQRLRRRRGDSGAYGSISQRMVWRRLAGVRLLGACGRRRRGCPLSGALPWGRLG